MKKETLIKRFTDEIEVCKIRIASAKKKLEHTKFIADQDWEEWVRVDTERLEKHETHLSKLTKALEEVKNGTSKLLSL